jgi:hypothetical protein
MFGFGKKKEKKVIEKPTKPLDQIADDIVGGTEWKQSKIGYLTGFSTAGKVVGSVADNLGQSANRVGTLFRMLSANDTLPELPEADATTYDGRQRFREAMILHRRNAGHIKTSITNTRRSAYLYAAVTAGSLIYLGWALAFNAPLALHTFILHLVPVPAFLALTVRSAYYNWMFRNQTLEPITSFIASKQWMPKCGIM